MERRRDDATCMCYHKRLAVFTDTRGSRDSFHDAHRNIGIECLLRDHRGRLVDGQPEDRGWTVYHLIEIIQRLIILLSWATVFSVSILQRRFYLLRRLAITLEETLGVLPIVVASSVKASEGPFRFACELSRLLYKAFYSWQCLPRAACHLGPDLAPTGQ
jgi:hypothetical protein